MITPIQQTLLCILRNSAEGRTKSTFRSPHGFISANEAGGFLDTDSYRKRILQLLAISGCGPAHVSQAFDTKWHQTAQEGGSLLPVFI